MSSSNPFSSVYSSLSSITAYEMEDEAQESDKCDLEGDSRESHVDHTDEEAYFDEPIADSTGEWQN